MLQSLRFQLFVLVFALSLPVLCVADELVPVTAVSETQVDSLCEKLDDRLMVAHKRKYSSFEIMLNIVQRYENFVPMAQQHLQDYLAVQCIYILVSNFILFL